uniref:Usp domain-containing protein n=2 Tax=Schistosoma mansoni TaxID=6183 RepID=A0A5K4FGW4_SCHMA
MNPSSKKRKICLPIDGSDHSKRAVQWFIKDVYRHGDEVLFVHCIELPNLPAISFTSGLKVPIDDWTKALQENIARSTKLNNEYGFMCESKKIPYDFVIKNGVSPGVGIVQAVEEHHVDLIVIGNRGLSRLKRTLLGSVSSYVVHNAYVPCIMVPPV